MIGCECILIEYGLKGIIENELPEDWGISWYPMEEKFIKEKGIPYYWQNKSKIEVLPQKQET
jgi:hypothetical protein